MNLEQAKKRIQECLDTQSTSLDLSNCGIESLGEIPELLQCTQLQILDLSNDPESSEPRNHITDISVLSALEQLKSLNLRDNNISDVRPLSVLVQLRELNLRGNEISGVRPLSALVQLRELNLWNNNISDVSPLSALEQLTRLDLGSNEISDVRPLSALEQLRKLNLRGNNISDVRPLRALVQLTELDLEHNNISDVSPLSALEQLTELNLWGNNISDVSLLSALGQLRELHLGGNKISDVRSLRALVQLTELDLEHNNISDVSHLSALGQLQVLSLRNNNISDVSHLSALVQLTELDLGHNEISDVKPLSALEQLTYLNLGHNNISDVSPLSPLEQLRELYLEWNNISDVSPLSPLEQLTELNLGGNEISDVKPLSDLEQLRELNLWRNNISDVSSLSSLSALEQLRELHLGGNGISDVRPLSTLEQLKSLNLRRNNIIDMSPLSALEQLTHLYLDTNNISDVSPLSALAQLTRLHLDHNNISDVSPLSDLVQLTRLNLDHNNISDVSPLSALEQLTDLDLKGNNIVDIPEFVFDLKNWEGIVDTIVDTNPVANPPVEIIKQGRDSVRAWFKANTTQFKEIKIILVGDPEAGKTSLLRRFKFNTFDKDETQTDGVNIVDIDFGDDSNTFSNFEKLHDIQGRFWDFGGQEIMTGTHRLFLGSRAVYILLLQARNDKANETQVRNWIKQIQATGDDSPIIVVANKMDINPAFDFENRYQIQRDYPQVQAFVRISCADNTNIDDLQKILAEIIPESGFLNTKVDSRYIHLKDLIKEHSETNNHLHEQTFKGFCQDSNVNLLNREDQIRAVDFLDSIGIACYFDKIKTNDYYVLDPNWVTVGLYRIMTSDKVASNGGKVARGDLENILKTEQEEKKEYTPLTNKTFTYELPGEINFIAQIMIQYKLAFMLKNNEEFIIPSLLSGNPNDSTKLQEFDNAHTLDFVFEYESLPKNISTELLILFHTMYGHQGVLEEYWRNGLLLTQGSTKALITTVNNRVSIQILSDDSREKRDLMAVCRAIVETVNRDLPHQPKQLIPLPNTNGGTVEYQVLLKRQSKNKRTYIYHEDREDEREFNIGELLEGMPTEDNTRLEGEKTQLAIHELETFIMKKLIENTKTLENIETQLHTYFQYLMELSANSLITKEEITTAVQEISDTQKQDMYTEMQDMLQQVFQEHQNDINNIDERLTEIFNSLNSPNTEKVIGAKLQLSIPLLNLIGINLHTDIDIRQFFKNMYKKYELPILKRLSEKGSE